MLQGWELLNEYNKALPRINERHAALGTFRQSSSRAKPERESRPYGGRTMSVARLKATGPTRQHVAIMTKDITM